jgi:hypothetical protein
MNILDSITQAIVGTAPAKRVDPKLAAFYALCRRPSVRDGVRMECGEPFLAEAFAKMQRNDLLWHEIHHVHGEAAARVSFETQMGKLAADARAGKTLTAEDFWDLSDFVEEQEGLREGKRRAATAIWAELQPARAKIVASFCKFAEQELQAIEASDSDVYAAYGLTYQASALVHALKSAIAFAKESGDAFRDILTAVAK